MEPLCPTCGNWARVEAIGADAKHHPNCPDVCHNCGQEGGEWRYERCQNCGHMRSLTQAMNADMKMFTQSVKASPDAMQAELTALRERAEKAEAEVKRLKAEPCPRCKPLTLLDPDAGLALEVCPDAVEKLKALAESMKTCLRCRTRFLGEGDLCLPCASRPTAETMGMIIG